MGRTSDAVTSASVRDALAGANDALTAAGIEMPRLDAELLLAEATGWERARFAAEPEAGVPAAAGRRFGELVRRRLRREPVAYILGRKGFRHIELTVDRRVLIPRPETELLVEVALELRPGRVLDVGTGSGAIALAVADELPGAEVIATDTSSAALEVARGNAERLGLAGRVTFRGGMIPDEAGAGHPQRAPGFDLVLANLPYVAERDWLSLQPEVTQWEPREALLAGPDGLDAYRAFIPGCGRALACISRQSSTTLAVEVGEGQAGAVGALMREAGFGGIEARRDLAGVERVVLGVGGGA
ncbi:MAG TPA: peptide chain release factor N(5)-glutamine methyltransferase [Solirubrobacterales bacterium]|nr:peptide chain release factor N(5)-glutamine methyltransferase [Solirubrobacterales bacterium]